MGMHRGPASLFWVSGVAPGPASWANHPLRRSRDADVVKYSVPIAPCVVGLRMEPIEEGKTPGEASACCRIEAQRGVYVCC